MMCVWSWSTAHQFNYHKPAGDGSTYIEGVNRGMEIRRSVLFFCPNPSIRHYFRSNPDPQYVKSYCGIHLLHKRVDVCFFPLDALGERNVGVEVIYKLVNVINVNDIDIFSIFGRKNDSSQK